MKAGITTERNEPNSLGPWLHLALVQNSVGDIAQLMMVNAHKYNHVPVKDMVKNVALAHEALNEFMEAYERAYTGNTGPSAH